MKGNAKDYVSTAQQFFTAYDAHDVDGSDGQSRISTEDFAIALVDELEQPKHSRQRFTVGY